MAACKHKNVNIVHLFWMLLPLLLISACKVIPKDYPSGKPFVFQTNINVNGNFSNEERDNLASRLKGQLDDSVRARPLDRLFNSVLKKPPVYYNANADKSVLYMRDLLVSLGYFKDSITYDTSVRFKGKDQYRTTLNFNVTPGKIVLLDSIGYNIQKAELQTITLANQEKSLLKKGAPFAKSTISLELDRLVDLYRENGYLRFNREELIGLWDTLDIALLRPSLDPFEQLEILQRLKERREKPTANLEIKLKPGVDSNKLIKYYIGNIHVYPDYNADSIDLIAKKDTVSGIVIVGYNNLFKPQIMPQNIYFRRGDLYDQRKYSKTINRFNSLGAWRLVSIEQQVRKNQDSVDMIIRLTPADKYSFSATLEGSNNQNAVSGNLFGIAINLGLQNRNFAKRAIQSSTNVRFGIETGKDTVTNVKFIQTRQFAISHNIYFPRLIPNVKWVPERLKDNFRTVLSINAANTERNELFNLTTFNTSWGYDFKLKNALFTLKIPNIEYSYIKKRQKLNDLIDSNALLKSIFADGLISSVMAGVTITKEKNQNISNFKFNVEESGLLTGFIKNDVLDSNLFRFVKFDAEIAKKIVHKKTALVLRLFAGIGYEFNSTVSPGKRYNLPLFRQYFAGGPNSMRAWSLRKLGPGSAIQDFGNKGIPERYGDLQLEANIEYRYPLFSIAGFRINGALFTDIGNVWYLKKLEGRDSKEIFDIRRLGQDLAVGVGTGVRIDFGYFVIRLDYSYKAKDPSPSPANEIYQNKWFGYKKWSDADQFQLGINYPFVL